MDVWGCNERAKYTILLVNDRKLIVSVQSRFLSITNQNGGWSKLLRLSDMSANSSAVQKEMGGEFDKIPALQCVDVLKFSPTQRETGTNKVVLNTSAVFRCF